MKKALITGITGQDGAYLSRLLLSKGYEVMGLIRSAYGSNLDRLKYLDIIDRVELAECDLADLSQVMKILGSYQPDEIYNLAAQSSVSLSFQQPIGTLQFNINSVLNILESIRMLGLETRFYQASTSEMYGRIEKLPVSEDTRFHPVSPYAISKVAAHYLTINYRESYNIFACCGILFNHESYLRGDSFFVKKVVRAALNISAGRQENLEVGNLDLRRDYGWSEKYVEAMWLLLQQDHPADCIISSGRSISLREIVEHVFSRFEIDLSKVKVSSSLFRPTEIEDSYGCNERAKQLLNWDYDLPFTTVLDRIIEEEKLNHAIPA